VQLDRLTALDSFQTYVRSGRSNITPLFVRLSQLATVRAAGTPSACALRSQSC
jgi:hypothetical protein